MTRLIIILLAVFIILTIIRSFVRRYRINTSASKYKVQNSDIDSQKKQSTEDNDITDAKFEEIK